MSVCGRTHKQTDEWIKWTNSNHKFAFFSTELFKFMFAVAAVTFYRHTGAVVVVASAFEFNSSCVIGHVS